MMVAEKSRSTFNWLETFHNYTKMHMQVSLNCCKAVLMNKDIFIVSPSVDVR